MILGGEQYINIIDLFYPIDSLFSTMNDEFDPNDYFIGTTWERITEKFIFARNPDNNNNNNKYNISGLTGGEETHRLTQEEIPGTYWHTDKISRDSINLAFDQGANFGIHGNPNIKSGDSHNNMPPYIIANIWRRIS